MPFRGRRRGPRPFLGRGRGWGRGRGRFWGPGPRRHHPPAPAVVGLGLGVGVAGAVMYSNALSNQAYNQQQANMVHQQQATIVHQQQVLQQQQMQQHQMMQQQHQMMQQQQQLAYNVIVPQNAMLTVNGYSFQISTPTGIKVVLAPKGSVIGQSVVVYA